MKDKFLYASLGIGFFIVALVFFYDDYSPLMGLNNGTENTTAPVDYEIPDDDTDNASGGNTSNPDAVTPEFHTIKTDETVFAIAKKYGLSVAELVQLNPGQIIDTGKKQNGQPIYKITPGGTLTLKKKVTGKLGALDAAGDFLQSIKCGEMLCPHSKKKLKEHRKNLEAINNSTASILLKRLNEIDNTYFSNGLRKDQFDLVKHKYKDGETVYSIAKTYNIRASEIPKYNVRAVTAKMKGSLPETYADGRTKYEIKKGAELIVFVRKK